MTTVKSPKSPAQKTRKESESARAYGHSTLPTPRAVTVKMAATMLSCCTKSIYRLIKRGMLVPIPLFRTILIPVDQIEALLKVNN